MQCEDKLCNWDLDGIGQSGLPHRGTHDCTEVTDRAAGGFSSVFVVAGVKRTLITI
jgi:hypothetical protein